MKVYLDNAASTRLHPEVLDKMMPYLSNTFGNPSSIHSFGRSNKAAIELARKQIAKQIEAKPNEIYFCASGTEANNLSLKLAVENLGVERIISSKVEHKCVLNVALYLEAEHQIQIDYVDLNHFGVADLSSLEILLKQSKVKTLVSLMHVQNELGSINNIEAIAKLCKENNALFHTDSVQGLGHLKYDLKNTPIDFLSASAHKFNGPLGIGFLYKRTGLELGTWLHGGGHEKNLRSSTENVAGIVGMAKALELANSNIESNTEHLKSLKNRLRTGLKEIVPGIEFNEAENSLAKILSATFPSVIANDTFLIQLDMAGIAISGGSACSSGAAKKSLVLETLNFDKDKTTVRFSFSTFNTIEEIDYVLNYFKK